MSDLSNTFTQVALDLVNVFGMGGCNIKRTWTAPSDVNTPTKPGTTVVTLYPCKAAVTDFKITEIDGTTVLQGDKQVIIPVQDTLPAEILVGDVFVSALGEEWDIVPKANPLEVNGIKVAYILQVRR